MAIGKKITQLTPEVEENVTNNTLIYIVNNGVSRQISLDNLIFDGFITALKLGDDAVVSGKIKSEAIDTRHLKAGIIEASKLKITGDGAITADTIGAATANALADAVVDIQSTASDVATLQGSVNSLQTAVADGGINTFYQATQPGTPALGDIWFDTADNKLYRWNGASWDEITDPDIATAIANAAAAANVADKKITTYFSDDAPTVDLIDGTALDGDDTGDLWFDTNDGNRLYRWNGSTWVEATDNRVSTLATQMGTAITDINNLQSNISDLQAAEDGGINTFYQSDEPTVGVDLGDLWVDTDDNKLYRYNGTSFDQIQDTDIATAIANAASAANVADKKITTYYGDNPPTVDLIDGSPLDGDDTGDLWFESDNNNKLHRWSGSEWVAVQDVRVDTLSTDLGSAVTDISTLSDRADGFVHTFFQDNQPTNADVATGSLQTGDLWIDTNDGNKLYRFNGSTFDQVQDADIQTAISNAAAAANVADNKITTYYGADAPTVDSIDGTALGTDDTGDLWFETDNNNKLHRWDGTQWVAVTDNRIDDILTDLGNAVTDITTLQGTTDGFVHTFYQGTLPTNSDLSGGGTIGVGDLWIDTNNNNTLKRYNGSGWDLVADANIQTAISNAAAAANVADNKITTYYGANPPTLDSIDGTALGVEDTGDLWFESDQNNKLHRWNGSAWVAVNDSRVDTLASEMSSALESISTLEAKADGNITTFYQTNPPGSSTANTGDLWIDSNDGNKLYIFRNNDWTQIRDSDIQTAISNAAAAANVADSKITTYYASNAPSTDAIDGTPLDEDDEGDLWFETDNFNKLYRWSGSAWQTVKDTSVEDNIYSSGTTTIDGAKITTGSITADRIQANTITSSSGIIANAAITNAMIDNINASKIDAGTISTSRLNIDNVTIDTNASGKLVIGNFEGTSHLNAGSIGFIGGIAGIASEDDPTTFNRGFDQDITVTEIQRTSFGANGYPKHISGENTTVPAPDLTVGTVMGDYKDGGSGTSEAQRTNQINNNVPLFKFNFSTGNYTGTREHLIYAGIDFFGTSNSDAESIFAVVMRQTDNPGAFRSTNVNDYIFTAKKSAGGVHSIAGFKQIARSVNLAGNSEYYIWCFGQADDGVDGYVSGYINVFGLQV